MVVVQANGGDSRHVRTAASSRLAVIVALLLLRTTAEEYSSFFFFFLVAVVGRCGWCCLESECHLFIYSICCCAYIHAPAPPALRTTVYIHPRCCIVGSDSYMQLAIKYTPDVPPYYAHDFACLLLLLQGACCAAGGC